MYLSTNHVHKRLISVEGPFGRVSDHLRSLFKSSLQQHSLRRALKTGLSGQGLGVCTFFCRRRFASIITYLKTIMPSSNNMNEEQYSQLVDTIVNSPAFLTRVVNSPQLFINSPLLVDKLLDSFQLNERIAAQTVYLAERQLRTLLNQLVQLVYTGYPEAAVSERVTLDHSAGEARLCSTSVK